MLRLHQLSSRPPSFVAPALISAQGRGADPQYFVGIPGCANPEKRGRSADSSRPFARDAVPSPLIPPAEAAAAWRGSQSVVGAWSPVGAPYGLPTFESLRVPGTWRAMWRKTNLFLYSRHSPLSSSSLSPLFLSLSLCLSVI